MTFNLIFSVFPKEKPLLSKSLTTSESEECAKGKFITRESKFVLKVEP
jgi:hypothetical protein